MTEPQTVATFKCLDTFQVLNVAANVNGRDFITSLEILTDGMRSGDVAVSDNISSSLIIS